MARAENAHSTSIVVKKMHFDKKKCTQEKIDSNPKKALRTNKFIIAIAQMRKHESRH